jgi:hypothetical protein
MLRPVAARQRGLGTFERIANYGPPKMPLANIIKPLPTKTPIFAPDP